MTQLEKILDIIKDTDKNFSEYYSVIPELIKKNNFKTYLEIGVFTGGQSMKVLETGCKVTGIDPYTEYVNGDIKNMPRIDSQSDFDLLYEVTLNTLYHKAFISKSEYIHIRLTSNDAFELLKDKKFDIIFLDGLHTYEQLKKDLSNYSKLVNKGGVIACHDYNHPYFPLLTNAIDEFVKENNAQLVIAPLHLVYFYKTW